MRKLFLWALIAALAAPLTVNAMDMTGKWGLGYFRSETPIGARFWLGESVGLDVGVGFESEDLGDESATSFFFEAGVPFVVYAADRANFLFRPGISWANLDARPFGIDSEEKWNRLTFTMMPVAEVFFGEHFSLEAGHGIEIERVSYPDEAEFGGLRDETRTDFRSIGASVTQIGFHFYF